MRRTNGTKRLVRDTGAMASLPLPALPRWVPPLAIAAWVALLVFAAWLATFDEIWADVASTVIGTIAGVAFAATGIAAILHYWQLQRLRVEMAPVVMAQLDVAVTRWRTVIEELLLALATVSSDVRAADPRRLAVLLGPPVNESAKILINQMLKDLRRLTPENAATHDEAAAEVGRQLADKRYHDELPRQFDDACTGSSRCCCGITRRAHTELRCPFWGVGRRTGRVQTRD